MALHLLERLPEINPMMPVQALVNERLGSTFVGHFVDISEVAPDPGSDLLRCLVNSAINGLNTCLRQLLPAYPGTQAQLLEVSPQ